VKALFQDPGFSAVCRVSAIHPKSIRALRNRRDRLTETVDKYDISRIQVIRCVLELLAREGDKASKDEPIP